MSKLRSELTSQDRKDRPIFSGVLKYFPDALLEVAELSRIANDKHNPGEPLHWSKGKSNDHGDALVRHQLDAGTWDNLEGHRVRHSAEVAWRALAQLQTEIENERSDGRIGISAEEGQAARDPAYEYNGDFGALVFTDTPFKLSQLNEADCVRLGFAYNNTKQRCQHR